MYVKKEIDRRLRKKEEEEVNKKMEHMESIKDDKTKYHYVMRDINKPTSKVPILVKDENGDVPGSTEGKIEETSTTPSCGGPIPAQKSRGNSVLGVVFSHTMPKMDFHYSHRFS